MPTKTLAHPVPPGGSNAWKHGHSARGGTRTLHVYNGMKARCLNPKSQFYKDYGGRGITICQRWLESFENFLADVGECPPGLTIDRWPNNDGNYEPGNVRWASRKEQANNRRLRSDARLITFMEETKHLSAWARDPRIANQGISLATLSSRLFHGWSVERAFTERPVPHRHSATLNGEQKTFLELAAMAGIPRKIIHSRIVNYGWSAERAISEKVETHNKRGAVVNGKYQTFTELAIMAGIPRHTFYARIDNLGWSIERAIKTKG